MLLARALFRERCPDDATDSLLQTSPLDWPRCPRRTSFLGEWAAAGPRAQGHLCATRIRLRRLRPSTADTARRPEAVTGERRRVGVTFAPSTDRKPSCTLVTVRRESSVEA